MKPFTVTELWAFLVERGQAVGRPLFGGDVLIKSVSPISATTDGSLSWMRRQELDWANIRAAAVICHQEALRPQSGLTVYIPVKKPRLAFALALARFAAPAPEPGVADTARIDPGAKVAPDCSIGHYTVIGGEAVIGRGTVIHSRVSIIGPVEIGRNCIIHSGAVLGSDGYGYERDEAGRPVKVPHLGGIRIGDEVEIGANTCIDRGTLGDTIIGSFTKIDNLCHIAHNVRLGEGVMVVAHTEISGSAVVGSGSWLAPGAVINEHLSVGARSLVGMGAVVTVNVPDGGAVVAQPSKSADGNIRYWLDYFVDP